MRTWLLKTRNGRHFQGYADSLDSVVRELSSRGVDLRGLDLSEVAMVDSHLSYLILPLANFTESALMGTYFCGSDLAGADFTEADLRGADFTGANLTSANFTGADVTDAVFNGADVTNARFTPGRGLKKVLKLAVGVPGKS